MLQLNFSDNPNGKLFAECFGDIRMADYEKFQAGNEMEIYLRKHELGVAKVIGYKDFSFGRLTDTMCFMNCGQGAHYQARLLQSYYGRQKELTKENIIMHIVFQWHRRNIPVQDRLLKDWWEAKREAYPYIQNHENQFT